jgi:hypothetical protein
MNKAVATPALGHCAIDQLVLVDQVLPINDRRNTRVRMEARSQFARRHNEPNFNLNTFSWKAMQVLNQGKSV